MRDEIMKEIPDANKPSTIMVAPNAVIKIYEGEYLLKLGENEFLIDGEIIFKWVPNLSVNFIGVPRARGADLHLKFAVGDTDNDGAIFINNIEIGKCFLTRVNEERIKGTFGKYVVNGDKNIAVDRIKFSVPNFYDFKGLPIQVKSENKVNYTLGRLQFEDDKYLITIDKCIDYKDRIELLEDESGYLILCNGELSVKKGVITLAETKEILACLNNFLTLLNGKKTAALFAQGIFEEQIIWTDFTPYIIDSHKNVQSWSRTNETKEFNSLWKIFRNKWCIKENRNFFSSVLHWYSEANQHAALIDGSIILAQTALELIYNWWIVEEKEMILGKDSDSISASNKIRLLISQLNVSNNPPLGFDGLIEFMKSLKIATKDAPEAIVNVRNAIVHSQKDKREKLSKIENRAKYEALQVYIWYIELCLLRILEYNGKYYDRCSEERFVAKAIVKVPWN